MCCVSVDHRHASCHFPWTVTCSLLTNQVFPLILTAGHLKIAFAYIFHISARTAYLPLSQHISPNNSNRQRTGIGSLYICQQLPNHKQFITDKCVYVRRGWGAGERWYKQSSNLWLMTSQILSKRQGKKTHKSLNPTFQQGKKKDYAFTHSIYSTC